MIPSMAGIAFHLMKSYLQRQFKIIETEATRLTALPEFNREEQVFLRREVVAVIRQRIDMARAV